MPWLHLKAHVAPEHADLLEEPPFHDRHHAAAAGLAGMVGAIPGGAHEPAGGTATDIACKDQANPIPQIRAAAMMLRHSFAENDAAAAIDAAVGTAIANGLRTGDIFSADDPNARQVGTTEMGDASAAAV